MYKLKKHQIFWGHRGRDRMVVLQLPMESVPSPLKL